MTANPGSEEGAGPRQPAGGPGPGGLSSPPPPPPRQPPPGYGYGDQPPPYPPGYGPPRRLVRRTTNRTFGGVAGGIADYFGVDAVLVRVGFIVLALVGGAGIPLYLLLWLIVPPATPAETAAARYQPTATANLPATLDRLGGWKAVLAFVVLLIGAGSLAGHFARPGLFWAVVLIGLGVYLFRLESTSPPAQPGPASAARGAGFGAAPEPGPAAPAGAPTVPHAMAPGPPYGQGQPEGAPPLASKAPPPPGMATATWPLPTVPPPPPPAPPLVTRPRERSLLGWVTVAGGLLVTGVAVALSNLIGFSLPPAGALGLFLMVLGLGLIVSAFRGRAGWLIVLGVLLVPVMVAASLLNPAGHDRPWGAGIGTRLWQPTSAAEVRPLYQLGGGQMILDLRRVDFRAQPRTVAASLGAGQLLVLVGESQAVDVAAQVNAGQITLFGRVQKGLRVTGSLSEPPNAANPLRLDLRVGAGEIDVRRLSPSDPVPEIDGVAPEPPAGVTTLTIPEPTTEPPATTVTTMPRR